MIDAAQRAEVSNAAPYRHFKDKDDLLRAVSELGFYELDRQTREVASQYEYGSQACIVEIGKAYIRFVSSQPAFFNLMWGEQGRSVVDDASKAHSELRVGGFWLMVNQVEAWCVKQRLPETDPMDISLKLWAMAIGISQLVINQHMERYVESVDPYHLLATSTHSFLRGLQDNTDQD